MSALRVGHGYRWVESQNSYRIFLISPNEDFAVVARTECTSTRLRRVRLSMLHQAEINRKIIPVHIRDEPTVPLETLKPDAKAKKTFEIIRPSLERLLAPGWAAISVKKMWREIANEAKSIDFPASTLNLAFTNVLLAGGVINAAIPRWSNCGRRKSSGPEGYTSIPTNQPDAYALKPADFDNIAAGVRRFLRNGESWIDAHDLFLKEYYVEREEKDGEKRWKILLPPGMRPSEFQFKFHGSRMVPLAERIVNQFGEKDLQTKYRGQPHGQSAPAVYPGVCGEIDWSLSDIVGVSRGSRLSIGRFIFYIVVDAYSGMIMAATASMFSASLHHAGRAIVACGEDKVKLCAEVDLDITKDKWDVSAIPSELKCDRGEIDSWKASGLGSGIGILLEFCAARRPDLKGLVESFFKVLRYKLRRLAGGTSGHRERLKEHPNVTAIYDMKQVKKLLYILVIAFNARKRSRQAYSPGMVGDGVLPVASHVYKWGKDRGCTREIDRDVDLAEVCINALPTHMTTVTTKGIRLMGLRFEVPDFPSPSGDGIDPNDWLMRARRERLPVEVGIDPELVDFVWLRYRRPRLPVLLLKCPLNEEFHGWLGLSWIEYGHNKEEFSKNIREYQETILRDVRSWSRDQISAMTRVARRMTQQARGNMSSSAQIAGAGERRQSEMESLKETNDVHEAPEEGIDFFDAKQWGASTV